jgi:hypothetical protein
LLFGGFVALMMSVPTRQRSTTSAQGVAENAFREAESKTVSYHGEVAFGNTPEAQRYAAAFAQKLELMRTIAFSKAEESHAPSLTKGHFLTYCEVRQGKICFLVHVPELRRYSSEAKDSLAKIAWELARQAGDPVRKGDTTRVGVGLRGVLLYGAVLTGTRQQEVPQQSKDSTLLHEFFTGPMRVAVEAPPAAR